MNDSEGSRALFEVRQLEKRVADLEHEARADAHAPPVGAPNVDAADHFASAQVSASGPTVGHGSDVPAQSPQWTAAEEQAFAELEAKAGAGVQAGGDVVAETFVGGPTSDYSRAEKERNLERLRNLAQQGETEPIRPRVEVSPGEADGHKAALRFVNGVLWDDNRRLRAGIREAVSRLRNTRFGHPEDALFNGNTIHRLAALLEDNGATRGGDGDPLPEPATVDPAFAIGVLYVSNSNGRLVLRDPGGRVRFRGPGHGLGLLDGSALRPVALPPEDGAGPDKDAEKSCD